MTSISVNNVAKNVQNMPKTKSPFDSRMHGKNFQEDNSFQNAIDLYKKPMDIGMSKKVESPASNNVEDTKQYAQNGSAKDRVKESGINKVKDEKTLSEDEMNAVEEAAEEIVSQVAKELNVSEEEVKAALETLGITVFDLGNVNQMVALFTEILGLSDGMQIVTNGDLFASLTSLTQSVNDVIQSVQSELQISVEELLAQLQEQITETSVADSGENADETQLVVETEATVDEEIEQTTISAKNVEEAVKVEVSQLEQKVVTLETSSTEMSQDGTSSEFQNRESDNSDSKQNLNQNSFSVLSDVNQTTSIEVGEAQNISYSTFNDIMEQIGDYVKTNVTADVKQMEIQLSPANLGQVNINMVSKNGVVTAQITAENEMVKNAIESQVVQLKERLESQGVKIEAVEVTVASHEFERNLDQNNENREAKEEVKKVSSRKWNLSEIDGELLEEEELTESERVELDMMKLTGNQLNYMV